MKKRMIFAGSLILILMALCTTKPNLNQPVYFDGVKVSQGIN